MSDQKILLSEVHLSGGLRASNHSADTIVLHPPMLDGTVVAISAKNGGIVPPLKALGFRVIGIDFFESEWELKGFVPPFWRPYHKRASTNCICFDAFTTWSRIGYGAFRRQEGRLWDIAGRIAHRIDSCSARLRRVSMAYHDQLVGISGRKDFKDGQRFADGYTSITYSEIESFLVDACTLRDNLAEFISGYFYAQRYPEVSGITTMASLLRTKVLNKDVDPISEHIRVATDRTGWLAELGHYRDLVVHSAPLMVARQRLMAVCASYRLSEAQNVPTVRYPLPEKPAEISAGRALSKKGNFFDDFSKQLEAFIGATAGNAPTVDALEYLHEAFGKLLELAISLSVLSPVSPETPSYGLEKS